MKSEPSRSNHLWNTFTIKLQSRLTITMLHSVCWALCSELHTFFSVLVYDRHTGDLIVTFPYVYILYPSLDHPLHHSLSSLTPFLTMTLTGFDVPYSYMYRKYLNHIQHPLPSLFTFPSHYFSTLHMTCCIFLSFIV
jgi:hypothetical protein